jgi:hypothetical protein
MLGRKHSPKLINMSSKSFIYQQMHFISVLENIKIYIKTYIKIAPTCFGLRPSSGSLHMSLAKVKFIKSYVVMDYAIVWQHVISSVQKETLVRIMEF